MDTSKTYIKMCEEAKKFLPKHEWSDGDLYSTVFHDGTFLIHTPHDIWADNPLYIRHPTECFPIYRQDQLQEMVRPNWKELPYLLTITFNEAVNGGSCSYTWNNGEHFTSMEQLWLAFVMKENHNKVWDGNAWA